ncbi:hypothetical protein Tco_1105153 [Tanacetum coccineum]
MKIEGIICMYLSEFADSVLNDDVDDSGTRLEPESHKENPKKVDDDDVEIEKEKKDDIDIEKEKKDDVEIEKEKKDEDIEKEKNNDNVKETYKVVKEKYIVDDVTDGRGSNSILVSKNKFVTSLDFFMSKICEVLDIATILRTTFAKTKEMITNEMPRLVNLAVNKDREVDPINAKEMIAKEFATHGPKND